MKAQIPRKTRSAKTGSNRRNAKAQLEQERLAIEARAKPYRKARGAFVRERKVVLTREAIKAAKPIFENARKKFALASLRLDGDVDAILKSKKGARRAIDRALLAAIPGYRRYETARNAYLQTRGTLFAKESALQSHGDIVADIGDAVISADVDFQVHRPPFAVHDVSTIDDVELLTLNESFADPLNGILFNNLKFSHNEDNWGGYNPTRVVHQSVSVGINFEVPATGFLRVGAVMRNIFNHFAYSVSDNFGFSHADLIVEHEIAIDIVRSGETTSFPQRMMRNGLISHGSDLSASESPIQNFVPITLAIKTKDAFLKGERIQILATSRVKISSDIDDMNGHADVVLTWQVRDISVGV
jgi:hypothetical protein